MLLCLAFFLVSLFLLRLACFQWREAFFLAFILYKTTLDLYLFIYLFLFPFFLNEASSAFTIQTMSYVFVCIKLNFLIPQESKSCVSFKPLPRQLNQYLHCFTTMIRKIFMTQQRFWGMSKQQGQTERATRDQGTRTKVNSEDKEVARKKRF